MTNKTVKKDKGLEQTNGQYERIATEYLILDERHSLHYIEQQKEMWVDTLKVLKEAKVMKSVQRVGALYLPDNAAFIIAGIILIDLLAAEHEHVYRRCDRVGKDDTAAEDRTKNSSNNKTGEDNRARTLDQTIDTGD